MNTYPKRPEFPFMDIGNQVFIVQSAFDPAALSAIHTQEDIAGSQSTTPRTA